MLAVTLAALAWMLSARTPFATFGTLTYHCDALAFWQGRAAAHGPTAHACASDWDAAPRRFHTFPREYPALALALFSLPLLTPWLPYADGFALLMALCLLLAAGGLAWRAPVAAVAFVIYVMLAGWNFVLGRYDLVPGLCVLLTLVLARRAPRVAAIVLALATLLKLFPLVLFPLLLIANRREGTRGWRGDLIVLYTGICLSVVAAAAFVNAWGLLAPLRYELARPPHIESLPGSLLWVASGIGIGSASAVFSFNSLNVSGGAEQFWTVLCALMGAVGVLHAYRRAWRGDDSLVRSFVVVLLLVLLASKVFSPQYVLWIVPTVAIAEGLRVRWLLVAGLVWLITVCYQTIPLDRLPWTPAFIAAILARNLLLCGLAVIYLATPGDRRTDGKPARSLWSSVGAWLGA